MSPRVRFPVWVWIVAAAAAAGAVAATQQAPWAWVLAPVALLLARRFPLEPGRFVIGVAVHAAAGLVLLGAWTPWATMAYWDLVVLISAIEYYRRFQALERQLAEAQLLALKMQLQPHFLFNALNAVSSLVRRDPAAAETMLARLGDFLRLTLESTGRQEVPLREELRFLESYLAIEQVRFRDRLRVRFEVDPAVQETPVPNLILQPIVENAVRHGGAGRIDIRAAPRDGELVLSVEDDGPGGEVVEGRGLSLTRSRLAELYGDASRLELDSPPPRGMRVTVRIPLCSAS